jgi:hypothetical protein
MATEEFDPTLSPAEVAALTEISSGAATDSKPVAVVAPAPAPAPSPSSEPVASAATASPSAPADWENQVNSWKGRFEQTQGEVARERSLAQLQAERAENIMRQLADEKKAREADVVARQELERKLAEATRQKPKLPARVVASFDDETAKEFEAWASSLVPTDVVRSSDLDSALDKRLAARLAEQDKANLASRADAFRGSLRTEAPGLMQNPDAFFAWAAKHPANPVGAITRAVEIGDASQIPAIKYWWSEYEKANAKPQGTQALVNSGSTRPTGGTSNVVPIANWAQKHEELLNAGKVKEAQALIDQVTKAAQAA